MGMSESVTRVIPDDLAPVVMQAILNLVAKDGDFLVSGVSTAALVLSDARSTNKDYDAWLEKRREATADVASAINAQIRKQLNHNSLARK